MKPGKIMRGAAAAALIIVAGQANAVTSPQMGVEAIVDTSMTLSVSSHLSFGSFVSTAAGGTVSVSTAGTTSNNFGPQLSNGTAGQFQVGGIEGVIYSYSIPVNLVLRHIGNSNIVMNAVLNTDVPQGMAGSRPISAGGTDIFNIGGDLSVSGSQPSGTYRTVVQMVAQYN